MLTNIVCFFVGIFVAQEYKIPIIKPILLDCFEFISKEIKKYKKS